jgi:photosystem II stability/assembly factor-like uncharacterized protein
MFGRVACSETNESEFLMHIANAYFVSCVLCFAALFAGPLAAPCCYAQETATTRGQWVNVSAGTLEGLAKAGQKTAWPGETAGVAVDPASGDVYMIIAGLGVWKSTDAAKTFARCDNGKVGGRCETAYALNFDPAGQRLACFMLDGKCAWTSDRGHSWHAFTDAGRNWDFAAVDWSTDKVQNIFAGLHESGGQTMLSTDGGQTWKKLFKDPEFDKTGGLGIFDDKTLVYTQQGQGIQRSTDGGTTWTKVADHEPLGRVVRVHKGKAYWLDKAGLLVSTDQGATWSLQGKPVDATIGPLLDPKNEQRMVVAGAKGISQTDDGGKTWRFIAPLPTGLDVPKAGWFSNVAWDPVHDIFYASKMGQPTYRWEPGR